VFGNMMMESFLILTCIEMKLAHVAVEKSIKNVV